MGTKQCFKCGKEQPLSAFYRHKNMPDGRLNKCKECTKKDVRKNRAANIEHYREYDRRRGNRQTKEYVQGWRKSNPEKYRAHTKLNNELRAGNITKKPCEVCGDKNVHGHHEDYSRPLDVNWLCPAHHKELHDKLEANDEHQVNE